MVAMAEIEQKTDDAHNKAPDEKLMALAKESAEMELLAKQLQKDYDGISLIGASRDPRVSKLLVFVSKYAKRLVIKELLHNQGQLADDIVQETVIKVANRLDSFKWNSKFATWIGAIAFNTWHDYNKKSSTKREQNELENGNLESMAHSKERNPLEILVGKEAVDDFYNMLLQLTDDRREAVLYFLENDGDRSNVKADLGITTNAFGKRLHDARKQLQEIMDREEGVAR